MSELMVVAAAGLIDHARALIDAKADVDALDKVSSFFHPAACSRLPACLLQSGMSAVDWSLSTRQFKLVPVLTQRARPTQVGGAVLPVSDALVCVQGGMSELMVAAAAGLMDSVRALLDAKADMHA